MRIPNLSVSSNVTKTIRDLELKRFELDQQISSGQKLKLPEDDGLRVEINQSRRRKVLICQKAQKKFLSS